MRIVRFRIKDSEGYGILKGSKVWELKSIPFSEVDIKDKSYRLEEAKILSPCKPSKIIAVGLNYIDHAKELGMALPEEPLIFLKPPSSVIGPGGNIVYPSMSSQVDYEAELAIVIKDTVKDIIEEEAPYHILGYTCSNDVTARDLQKKDGQWTRAKSFDTFTPLGPWIETELNPSNLKIELFLNGVLKQSSSTSNMIFNPYFLVSYISKVMTLFPGDVIMTGTPPGVGPLKVGDKLEVKIEGIGTLRNYVVGE